MSDLVACSPFLGRLRQAAGRGSVLLRSPGRGLDQSFLTPGLFRKEGSLAAGIALSREQCVHRSSTPYAVRGCGGPQPQCFHVPTSCVRLPGYFLLFRLSFPFVNLRRFLSVPSRFASFCSPAALQGTQPPQNLLKEPPVPGQSCPAPGSSPARALQMLALEDTGRCRGAGTGSFCGCTAVRCVAEQCNEMLQLLGPCSQFESLPILPTCSPAACAGRGGRMPGWLQPRGL